MTLHHPLYVNAGEDLDPVRFPTLLAGAEVDVSTWDVAMQIRASQSPTAELRYQAAPTLHNGYVELTIPGEDSAEWSWFDGYYDIVLTDPANGTNRLVQGPVYVNPRTTIPA